MKKIVFMLMAAMLMGVAFTSCSDKKSSDKDDKEITAADYIDKEKEIVADIEKNGNDWASNEWEDVFEDFIVNEIAFYKSKPSKEEMKKYFEKRKIVDIFGKLGVDAQTKAVAAIMKVSNKYEAELEEAQKAATKDAGDESDEMEE